MSNAKHTPGPWTAEHGILRPRFPTVIDWISANDGKHQVVHWSGFDASDSPPDVREANTLLIAAAPELLAALKAVIAIADRKTIEFDAARAAIAKATGDSP